MVYKKRVKTFLLGLLFFLLAGTAFSVEEYVSKVYKEIDVIFVKKAEKELENILRENVEDKYYYLMENYTKKKVRRLIIDNEYEFAMTAIYIIIDNNIDGDFEDEDAVDLYAAIAEAYEIQQAYEEEQERKAIAEAAKKEAEKEKIRTSVEKEYNVTTTSEGKTVYVSARDERTQDYKWNIKFGMIDFGVTSSKNLPHPVMGEGISIDASYEYTIPKTLVLGGDVFFDFKFMQFNSGPMSFNFEIAPKIAFPALSSNLFLRIGFSDLGVLKNKDATILARNKNLADIQNGLYGSVVSPLVGIQFDNLKVGKASLTFDANYLLSGVITGDYQALSFKGYMAIPFAELEQVKLVFNIGARDTLLILKQGGVENHLSAILGFGVENVIR
ncbi:MAG: hypothetical protein K5907_05740 [Treponema sp.]|nr:hypothetical protein [Treponema sp.]